MCKEVEDISSPAFEKKRVTTIMTNVVNQRTVTDKSRELAASMRLDNIVPMTHIGAREGLEVEEPPKITMKKGVNSSRERERSCLSTEAEEGGTEDGGSCCRWEEEEDGGGKEEEEG